MTNVYLQGKWFGCTWLVSKEDKKKHPSEDLIKEMNDT